jgi:hypothetical protein
MTEFNEPVWVGMDVEAELAAYEAEGRERAEKPAQAALRRSPRGGPAVPFSLVGKEATSLPQCPLVA